MTEFLTPVDIGNRALQHCGAALIDPLKGFAEVSKSAAQVSFCYGKLRRAELQTNVWTNATRRTAIRPVDTTTMLLVPSLYVAGTTYFVGSIVSDANGNIWSSRITNNLGNDPQNAAFAWEPYFGPLTVLPYDSGEPYLTGELVYVAPGDGTYRVYLSRQDDNGDDPTVATAWDAGTTYFKNQVATYSSVAYMSLIDLNVGQQPDLAPALWDSGTTYSTGAKVGGSDGVIYQSIAGGNLDHDPTLDLAGTYWTNTGILNPWTTVFVGGSGSDKWLQIGGAEFPNGVGLRKFDIVYPLGAGPASHPTSRNVYRLPSGFLREAPQYPNRVANWLGGPSFETYTDWTYENDFLLTAQTGTIVLRFVADITDVSRMNDMFCEGLAARIALEVCQPLTQSTAQLGAIAKIYDEWIERARTRNAIEAGPQQPPDDDYITVRL